MNDSFLKTTPIAVFAYNRPVHLLITLQALKQCEGYADCPLYIYCDVPSNPVDFPLNAATQAVAKQWVEQNGGTLIIREKNYIFLNIVEGITELCNRYGRVIVVEDDIVVSPDFLTYMRRSLDKYEESSHVYTISGFMYHGCQPEEPSTFFLPFPFIWGWATWQRAWQHFRMKPEGWEEFLANKTLCHRFNFNNGYKFTNSLRTAMTTNPPHKYAWDIQWAYISFTHGALNLAPNKTLIWNTGMSCGVHGKNKHIPSMEGRDYYAHGNMQIEDFTKNRLPLNWKFPADEIVNETAFKKLCTAFKKQKWKRKFHHFWKKHIRREQSVHKP